jgi:hypothetical protein
MDLGRPKRGWGKGVVTVTHTHPLNPQEQGVEKPPAPRSWVKQQVTVVGCASEAVGIWGPRGIEERCEQSRGMEFPHQGSKPLGRGGHWLCAQVTIVVSPSPTLSFS